MGIFKKKKKQPQTEEERHEAEIQDFLDMICPSVIRFYPDYYICGNTYRAVWAIRSYAPTYDECAILRDLGERDGVTLKIYTRPVSAAEQTKIIRNAQSRNNQQLKTSTDIDTQLNAAAAQEEMKDMLLEQRKRGEPLLYTAVYVEMTADSLQKLQDLEDDISMLFAQLKILHDRLLLRQREGFVSVMPVGYNEFGEQFERVLPASSVANMYPFNYSGKTDTQGFYIGKDKFGTNIIVDFNRRTDDKTNGNILILGNSGQGKSFLFKLITTNFILGGYNTILLDADGEYRDLVENFDGYYVDLLSGRYIINVLEPKMWDDGSESDNSDDTPKAFMERRILNQHIAFLRDFFANYKDFETRHLDTLEILLFKLYEAFGLTDAADISELPHTAFPTLRDLYDLVQSQFGEYDKLQSPIYTKDTLRELLLMLHSISIGSDSKYFNGHTNIESDRIVCFGVKGLLETNENLKSAMLFNVLSYMSHSLLTKGNTVAGIDELHAFLANTLLVRYIRDFVKRVRKKYSAVILASQNLEDFNLPGIKEYTKPLFAIPTHQFLFNAGSIDKSFYMDYLQLEQSEYDLIKYPERGTCLYKCGAERYNLQVIAPEYKSELFGSGGGK